MSDNWISLIPEDPQFVPEKERQKAARERFRSIAPGTESIEIRESGGVQFYDCGGNFEKIICPLCGKEIGEDWWQEQMDEDYAESGFKMDAYVLPCCGASQTLAQLTYEWPQGFARFSVDAMNPASGVLSPEQLHELELILGTPLRVIRQHI